MYIALPIAVKIGSEAKIDTVMTTAPIIVNINGKGEKKEKEINSKVFIIRRDATRISQGRQTYLVWWNE